ncbi:MAG: DPP IV N-terminal domain-containing protein [Bacteroidales bacterium]|jgi:dipeptidyl-peptidase-4|nr:DPP IV N-terminal domain-containing protein [Bacteroidales bacterium]
MATFRRITTTLLILFIYTLTGNAQQQIDLQGIFKGKYRLDNLRGLSWRPNNQSYSYIEHDTTFVVDLQTGIKSVLIEEKKSADLPEADIIDQDVAHQLYVINRDNYVFVMKGNDKKNSILLCPDTGKNIVFGQTVHRSEWGIDEGQYFSPQGNYIAFYRMDERMVEDYPLVNVTTPIATVELMKYPMAGRTSHQVKVGIFDVKKSFETGKTAYHYILTDIEDGEFLTNITFSPDEKFLYIHHLNRAQNHSKLIRYDVLTGKKSEILYEEKDGRYVEPQTRPIFLKNGNLMVQSNRDGWNHLYLFDTKTKKMKQITKGHFPVINVYGMDAKEEFVYIQTNKDAPMDRYLYKVNIKTGALTNLTPESGTHSVVFNGDMTAFFDYFSNAVTPLKISVKSTNGKINRQLINSKNPYTDCQLNTPKLFSIKNNAGDDLYCRLILPVGFDSTKQYPTLIYVYGGPHSQLVTNNFMSGGVFLYYLSQQGYVVFTLDNRGTANRGAEFEKCIHRTLGIKETEDQRCGVKWLKQQSFVDADRIGLDGWSYGGFMTLTLITEHPELFKAASCGGPVVDWSKYEVMYGERYMDTPQENPEGYENSNILNKVSKIACPLLVIHDALDHTVVWQQTQQLLNAAIKNGIQMDYFIYPNHDHNVSGTDRVHLWNKLVKFHEDNLK